MADLLTYGCRFFDPPVDQETAIRQMVGKEILDVMELWVNKDKKGSAQRFIRNLAGRVPEIEEPYERPKKGENQDG